MSTVLTFRIILEAPPAGVLFGLQKGAGNNYQVEQKQVSKKSNLQFEFTAETVTGKNGNPDFKSKHVQGPAGQRFVYIDIGTSAGDHLSEWTRRLKIPLYTISQQQINEALAGTKVLTTTVPGTGRDGTPNCATVKPFDGWHAVK